MRYRKYISTILLGFVCYFISTNAYAYSTQIDSSQLLRLNSRIADYIEDEQIATAIDTGLYIIEITKDRLNSYLELVGETHYYLGYAYLRDNRLDKSEHYFQEALTFWQNIEDPFLIELKISCHTYLGIIDQNREKWDAARLHFEDALTYTSSDVYSIGELMAYHNLGISYKALDDFEKAKNTYQKGLSQNKSFINEEGILLDSLQLIETLNALCGLLIDSDQLDSARYYLNQTNDFLLAFKSSTDLANYYTKEGLFYEKKGFLELKEKWHKKSIELHQKALQIREVESDSVGMLNSWMNIGANHEYLQQYSKAINAYKNGEWFLAYASTQDSAKLYMNLSDSYLHLNDESLAKKYRELCSNLNLDKRQILEYSQEKEERVRIIEAKESQERVYLVLIFSIVSLFSLSIFILSLRSVNQRKKATELQLEKVNLEVENKNLEVEQTKLKLKQANLEMEQTFERAERNILKAQNEAKEQTLKKVSKELHDHIGAGLAGLVRELKNYIPKLGGSEIPKDRFSALCDELNNYYENVREMSHYMANLYLFEGLHASILEFQDTLKHRGLLFKFETLRMKGVRFSEEIEINVFRIVQEALENAFKYADTQHIEVQLVFYPPKTGLDDGLLTLTIEDEGKGFDMGYSSRRDRYHQYAGTRRSIKWQLYYR